MIRRKYQSYAYLARGHWAVPVKEYEKMGDYSKKEYEQRASKTFELWFVFSDYFPEATSNISFDDMMNLPSLEASERRYDEDVKSANDDIANENQWRLDTTTALGISKHLHEYIHYTVDGRDKSESKIGFWRTCKSSKTGEGKMDNPYVVTPKSADYKFYSKSFGVEGNKTLFMMFPKKKDESINKAFVADEVIEIKHAKIASDDSYSLYDCKQKTPKLIKKGKLTDALDEEELEKMKQAVKDIEEKVTNSGAARRLPTVSHSSGTNVHRISANDYGGYNRSYSRPTSQSSGSGGGWVIVVILIIVVLIFMFAH